MQLTKKVLNFNYELLVKNYITSEEGSDLFWYTFWSIQTLFF